MAARLAALVLFDLRRYAATFKHACKKPFLTHSRAMVTETARQPNLYWNYFLALEQDMEKVSRYIEFCTANEHTFSIELAHLLLATASEVDVLAKCFCEIIEPKSNSRRLDILDYQKIITAPSNLPRLPANRVLIPRYGLILTPWENWLKPENPPGWWRSYNNVKHKRNQHFHEATLQNALDALGALLVLNFHFPTLEHAMKIRSLGSAIQPQPGTLHVIGMRPGLLPASSLMRLQTEEDQLTERLAQYS